MANNYQSISYAVGILQNLYQGPIVSQFNDDTDGWRGAAKGKHPWQGKQVVRPLKVRRNPGVGATSDGGALPPIGRQTNVEATIAAKYHYGRLGITGPSIKAGQSKMAAFVQLMSFEMEELYNDMQKELNRAIFWDGTGTIATMNSTAAATTSLSIAGRETTEPALKFIDVDSCIDILSSSGTLKASGVNVTAISGTVGALTATLTVDQVVTASSTDIIVRTGSYNIELQGLLTQLDAGTSTIYGVDRSAYPATQGNVVDLSSAQLTINALQQACDEADRRGGRKNNIAAIFSDYASRRMYHKLLQADKRFVNTVEGDGGFARKGETYLAFNEIPWIADADCPQRIFFVPAEYFEKYVMPGCEFSFADETGEIMIAESENDRLEARMRFFGNMFNCKAAGSAAVKGYISP